MFAKYMQRDKIKGEIAVAGKMLWQSLFFMS